MPARDFLCQNDVQNVASAGSARRVHRSAVWLAHRETANMAKGEGARHTGCRRGTKVMVKLRDGREIEDIFHERTDRFVFLRNHGRIRKGDISQFTALKRRM